MTSHPGVATTDLLADYFQLTDVALRKRLETPRGLYIAESYNVIERALRAGHTPRSMLLETKWVEKMRPLLQRFEAEHCPIFVGKPSDIEQLTGYRVHRGALASMHRPHLPTPHSLLQQSRRVAVLEDIVDHTNVGAIFRSAAALGIDAVLVSPRCADPLYRRSVRVSMGSVFQVPWTRLSIWPPTIELHDHGYHVAALALSDKATQLNDYLTAQRLSQGHERLALILGTEGNGISKRTLETCDELVTIPMSHGVDSLNVAAASAVAFFALR
ncbi:MAG: RNA methyltransferase [Actinomycetaceae bacterium]|nr:RNA methyltransferase [Actinomycetaceae bacterium]